jgi:hypothetical protein
MAMSYNLLPYEKKALDEIKRWKHPEKDGFWGKLVKVVNAPINKAGELVMNAPSVGDVIKKVVSGITSICNDAAQFTVRQDAIIEDFRKHGCDVNSIADIQKLELEKIDEVVGYLAAKYKGIAGAEGAVTGALGLPGIPPDLIAVISINLRAIGEYCCYYGFNNNLQEERLFAMNVLSYASSAGDAGKGTIMASLVKISRDVAAKKTWKELEEHAMVLVIKKIAESLGVRLTKAKLAQLLPVFGSAVGGGYNAYYTAKVCETASFMYRERFLATKYDETIIVD